MNIGILTRNPKAWCSHQLLKAIKQQGHQKFHFDFRDLLARIAYKPYVSDGTFDIIASLNALLVRPIGRGSLDEIIFRLDLLRNIERNGVPIINSPPSIERAVDKYHALAILQHHDLPVPKTVVTEDPRKALKAFHELGGDIVVKPLFGSRGVGITRVTDAEVARRIFKSLAFVHHVLYLQEFIPHDHKDIRAFVINDHVVAAMYRLATGWKTNVSQGAKVVQAELNPQLEHIAVSAAQALGCTIAGVDIMQSPSGNYLTEVNSQPGFQALQTVSQINIADQIIAYISQKYRK
ncbi:MAG: RimK family alpha-L-glutamate ligase [Candidatus Bathyarchaeota archaeon]|nr:RimK family alpha-L-glutamate ligase [Candidatus Bathyarchaeota archaeon]